MQLLNYSNLFFTPSSPQGRTERQRGSFGMCWQEQTQSIVNHQSLPENPSIHDSTWLWIGHRQIKWSRMVALNMCAPVSTFTAHRRQRNSPCLFSCAHAYHKTEVRGRGDPNNHSSQREGDFLVLVFSLSSFFVVLGLAPAGRFATHRSNNQLCKQSALSPWGHLCS